MTGLMPIVHGGHSSGIAYTVATGGTITTDGSYKVHTFNSSNTFEITKLGADAVVQYLVIAGAGSGGGRPSGGKGGGGGAGAFRAASGFSVTAQSYSVTVGAGGAAVTSTIGNDGSDSVFSSITSDGGGAGGVWSAGAGNDGGSAGGGADPAGVGGDSSLVVVHPGRITGPEGDGDQTCHLLAGRGKWCRLFAGWQ